MTAQPVNFREAGPTVDFDVAIVGAGPVGLAFAGWLADVWGDRADRLVVFDSKPLEDACHDPRLLALSDATRLRLAALGFPNQATPIHHIHVSEQHSFGQVRMHADELGLRALGWTVRYGDLVKTLSEAVQNRGVRIERPAAVQFAHRSPHESLEVLELEDGREVTVNLRVDAEGGLYGEAGERDHIRDYDQWALICEVQAEIDRSVLQGGDTMAFERFTAEGPAALLPTSTDQKSYSLVWCAPRSMVEQRLSISDEQFADQLRLVFGRRVQVLSSGRRLSFPLGMNWRDSLVQGRRVAIGNAAQILHPVAGQGLNLGLRDASVLVRMLNPSMIDKEQKVIDSLLDFDRSRRLDRQGVVRTTDLMVRGFSNQNPWLGLGRQTALNVLEMTPPLRRQFTELMLFGMAS